jgi:hypothetical protein
MTIELGPITSWMVACAISWILGFLLIGSFLKLIWWTAKVDDESFSWLVFWIGGIERSPAITLALLALSQLAAFSGGWTVLEFAAGWQREPDRSRGVTSGASYHLVLHYSAHG